jgi:hypothetical protein
MFLPSGMAIMIQIRHVDAELHRTLTTRAAEAGMTLSDYLKRELARLVARPSMREIRRRISALEPVALPEPADVMIRRERDAR